MMPMIATTLISSSMRVIPLLLRIFHYVCSARTWWQLRHIQALGSVWRSLVSNKGAKPLSTVVRYRITPLVHAGYGTHPVGERRSPSAGGAQDSIRRQLLSTSQQPGSVTGRNLIPH